VGPFLPKMNRISCKFDQNKIKDLQLHLLCSLISRISCIVMDLVKNSRLPIIVQNMVDMNRVKNDVLHVKYSWNGKVCGVLAVDVY